MCAEFQLFSQSRRWLPKRQFDFFLVNYLQLSFFELSTVPETREKLKEKK